MSKLTSLPFQLFHVGGVKNHVRHSFASVSKLSGMLPRLFGMPYLEVSGQENDSIESFQTSLNTHFFNVTETSVTMLLVSVLLVFDGDPVCVWARGSAHIYAWSCKSVLA